MKMKPSWLMGRKKIGIKKMKNFIKIITGSHLYGLNNSSSDIDYKIISIPSKEDCYLNRIPRIKSTTSQEEDVEIIPIQEFIKQACSAQTNVIDMIHAPESAIEWCDNWDIWRYIQTNKTKLYTKRMKGTLGFCVSQSQRYSFKIEKYNDISDLISHVRVSHNSFFKPQKLSDIWCDIKESTYIKKSIEPESKNEDKRCLLVDKRIIQIYTPLTKVLETLESIKKSFGSRVKDAKEVDWKSISHAFRIGYQLQHIYEDGGYEYPLPENDFLRKVKEGGFDYQKDEIGEKLQNLIDKCVHLGDTSEYPDEVDREFWDNVILKFYE